MNFYQTMGVLWATTAGLNAFAGVINLGTGNTLVGGTEVLSCVLFSLLSVMYFMHPKNKE